jgi:hypothetical protein
MFDGFLSILIKFSSAVGFVLMLNATGTLKLNLMIESAEPNITAITSKELIIGIL